MDVYSGELEILLPNEIQWQVIQAGEFFEVPANAKFGIKIISITDYCCSFVD